MITKNKGYTLIEILVVITVFVVLSVLVTQSLLLSIRSSRKSLAISKVKNNLNEAIVIVGRNIRNARSMTCSGDTTITYVDAENVDGNTFVCSGTALSWNGNNVTSSDIELSTCTLACDDPTEPTVVSVTFVGTSSVESGIEGESVSVSTKIVIRNQ